MIFYLLVAPRSGMTAYVDSWGPAPNSRMRYLLYNDLRYMRQLERATYIFTDHERLSPPQWQLARQLWKTLSNAGPPMRLVNDPWKVLGRFDFLDRLFAEGINRFRAVRANEPVELLRSLRYPVFAREEKAHKGTLTPLLHRPDHLLRALRRLSLEGYYRKDLLVVEYCSTADSSGVFRKYSAVRIAGQIIPRHVLFSRSWNLKTPDLDDRCFQAEHDEYLATNPHQGQIERVFDLGGFDYGRIDYSLLDGELQVWEINSNPTVRKLTPRLTSGFEQLDDVAAAAGSEIPWSVSPDLDRALKWSRRMRFLTRKHRELAERARKRLPSAR
jgi:hypothetical protein